jgi:L-gulono-1,4-lactone dehydrogenase
LGWVEGEVEKNLPLIGHLGPGTRVFQFPLHPKPDAMKKIWGKCLKFIKHVLTQANKTIDHNTLELVKQKSSEAALLKSKADLIDQTRPEIPGPGQTWVNTLGSVVVHPQLAFAPASVGELQDLILKAEQGGNQVRAVGSGHSFSDVAPTNDFLVYTHQLNKPLALDPSTLKLSARQLKLFHTEAGITLHDLNEFLNGQNQALSTMGSYDAQTLIGAISTGTHGTGLAPGAMSGMVRSIGLVCSGGRRLMVEPGDGISDPAKFNVPGQSFQLLQDDATFYSVLVSMGCMGIIYSLVIEVMDSYWLDEQKTLSNWHLVEPELRAGSVIRDNLHYEVQVNPYSTLGSRSCLVTTQKIIAEPPHSVVVPSGHRNYLSALLDMVPLAPEIVRFYLDLFPKKIPRTIDNALKSLQDDPHYFNQSYKVLYEGLPNFKRIGYACEFAFPLAGNRYLDAVEKIFEVAGIQQSQNNKYIDSPVSLRFVKASGAYLTMEYGADCCLIDIPSLFDSRYSDQMMDIMQDAMIQMGGKPHWGKLNNQLRDKVTAFYPKFPDWQMVRNKLDPGKMFSNDFTRQFGL